MTKKILMEHCNELGIDVPEGATNNAYFEDAAVIKTDNGLQCMQTVKDTEVYTIEFIGIGYCTIRAENEEVARIWVEENMQESCYTLDFGYGIYSEITDWEIGDSFQE